jgi:hypothetical protein
LAGECANVPRQPTRQLPIQFIKIQQNTSSGRLAVINAPSIVDHKQSAVALTLEALEALGALEESKHYVYYTAISHDDIPDYAIDAILTIIILGAYRYTRTKHPKNASMHSIPLLSRLLSSILLIIINLPTSHGDPA